jgi:hypothetical protein
MTTKSFHSILREISEDQTSYEDNEPISPEDTESFPLCDGEDIEILMQCEVHFGGCFSIMLDYYKNEENKGVIEEFSMERIHNLQNIESQINKSLPPLLVSGADAEKIGRAKKAYKQLKEIYEFDSPQDHETKLIANLILSEEELPEEDIQAITAKGKSIVPALTALLKSEEFKDTLFPGYGQGPTLAAYCLGEIGEESAIPMLFEEIKKEDFFSAQVSVQALKKIGSRAKEFLLKTLSLQPLTQDNDCASFALLSFEDPIAAKVCLNILKDFDVNKNPFLTLHLVMNCSYLNTKEDREVFKELTQKTSFPSSLDADIKAIFNDWKTSSTLLDNSVPVPS